MDADTKYKVAIIGCGSIGALKPDEFDRPGGKNVLTHAHAFHKHPRTELSVVIDSDTTKAIQASLKWDCDGYNYLPDNNKEDIIVVASPTNTHYDILQKILKFRPRPKLVIAEKPFCLDQDQAQYITHQYRKANVPLLVNYTRRFVPGIIKLQESLRRLIRNGGVIYHARMLYGRGLYRDGCHAIDLFNFLFGMMVLDAPIISYILDRGDATDPTISAQLSYAHCKDVRLVGIDSMMYSVFELDIITSAGKIVFSNHGNLQTHYLVEKESVYGSYPSLRGDSILENDTGLSHALTYMVSHAVDIIERGVPGVCTGEDAVEAHINMNLIHRAWRDAIK